MRNHMMIGALLALAAAAPLRAQSGDGYLFGRPAGSLTLRGGFSHARAGSDLYDELTKDLTLKKGDFSGVTFGVEGAVRVADRLDLTADVGYTRTDRPSSYRNFVDNNNREIEQRTSLSRLPVTLNAKLYLTPPGRSIGRFAWIPSGVVPWIGAGGGFLTYSLHQEGDFVDFSTNNVHHDVFNSSGSTPLAQGMAGVDVSITPRLAITGDARYLWAKGAALSSDYLGYQPLDLSGAVLSLGLTVRL